MFTYEATKGNLMRPQLAALWMLILHKLQHNVLGRFPTAWWFFLPSAGGIKRYILGYNLLVFCFMV